MMLKKILLLILLLPISCAGFAFGLTLEIINQTDSIYLATIWNKKDYEDLPTYPQGSAWFNTCDDSFLNVFNRGIATTWCGYSDGCFRGKGGGYAIVGLRKLNSTQAYVKIIVIADRGQLARIITYSEEARESNLHVRATCLRLQNYDHCKLILEEFA